MNERSLRVLEFPKIIHMLKALTTFAPGKELADALQPANTLATVKSSLQETAEAIRLLRDHGAHPLAGARDIRAAVGRAARGGVLSSEELLDVAYTASVMRRNRRLLIADDDSGERPLPLLATLGEQLTALQPLERSIRAAIGDDAVVHDRASDKLARLRAQIRTWQARSRERIDALVHSAGRRQVLQEAIVTVRNERYVVPVKVEHKAAVPGIVHDTSSSGATVFIEPLAVVELNNKVKEAQADEAREVERILRQLSGLVGGEAASLAAGIDALARLDLAFAKALLAGDMGAVQPEMNDDGRLELLQARHPLLTGTVVPIDVWLGGDVRLLVITGPNTGGKTVTLKTIGLFCLMAQSGLFVPAHTAKIPVHKGIYADIGDEQSIEQSLSTFSAHMANVVHILARADEHSLVLLDELGAGTDPAEGASLAMAILQHLSDVGVNAVATTHYSELKSFVHERPAMQNASVEFDAETLAPTYRLIMGTPGRSNALEIAARLGLPDGILAAARGQFAKADDVRVEDLLRDLENARREAQAERRAALRLREESEELRARIERTRTEQAAKRDEWERRAREDARHVLTEARQEVEAIIADLRRRGDEFGVEQARKSHRRIAERLRATQAKRTSPNSAGKTMHTEPMGDAPFVPRVGDTVKVLTLNQTGTVHSGPDGDGQWTIQVGSMRIVVPNKSLAPSAPAHGTERGGRHGGAPGTSRGATGRSGLLPAKRAAIAPEISLRGLLVDDALYELEKYLDDALLAGLDKVFVVHGKGTGALRRAVHDYVKDHPHVKNWHIAEPSDGGYGVTVVEL